ncbi:hypothetical protein Bca4012_059451 [Brassica carinata]
MLLERNPSQIVKILGDWGILYENSGGFTGISFRCLMSHFSFGMLLPVVSSGLVLFRSLSSLEDKTVSPRALPMARDVSSDSWSSVCFSFFISLSSCVAVSTGPEDAIEITSVVLVDEGWTSTSHYVTILQLSDSVEDFVLCPLSSSVEDLSCLAYLYVVVYAYYRITSFEFLLRFDTVFFSVSTSVSLLEPSDTWALSLESCDFRICMPMSTLTCSITMLLESEQSGQLRYVLYKTRQGSPPWRPDDKDGHYSTISNSG